MNTAYRVMTFRLALGLVMAFVAGATAINAFDAWDWPIGRALYVFATGLWCIAAGFGAARAIR